MFLSLSAGGLSIACGRSQGAASPNANAGAAPSAGVTGNPFAGIELYRAPYSNAENAQRRAEKESPAEAALLAKIASQPQASWYGGWSGDIETVVGNYVNAAERAGQLALLVAYNVPNRDCGQYSAGGARDSGAYLEWIEAFAVGIGERRAVVVLEPDAVPLLEQCLSKPDQGARLELIARAAAILCRAKVSSACWRKRRKTRSGSHFCARSFQAPASSFCTASQRRISAVSWRRGAPGAS